MRKVLVTGGSRGIGAATVEKFSGLGDKVAFVYNNSTECADALAKKWDAYPIKADISTPEGVKFAINSAAEYLGGLDILVSNAGVSHIAQICDTDDDDWRRVVDTDLSGPYYLLREASKIMVREHKGRIITVGSVWGKCGASCESAYSAAKAGIRGLTMALAKELGPSGITVNCVEPGIIMTDMNACFDENTIRSLSEEIPAGRLGDPSEVASLIAFLSSDDAAYINGQCIAIDGGWCI